jgi:DNA invertase Pin-like site-specific DNA recombinase
MLLLSGSSIAWRAPSANSLINTTVLLNERGVELHSLTENINTTTPSGKLTFHIFAALAEFERDILRQRVNAGLKAARRRGRVGGRPKALGEADLKKARALLRSGDYTKVQVAQKSRHTLWRALVQQETPLITVKLARWEFIGSQGVRGLAASRAALMRSCTSTSVYHTDIFKCS